MNVLIIGSGGREHVLAWMIKKSPQVDKLYAWPGNGGMSDLAVIPSLESDSEEALIDFAKNNAVDITVVGPEAPLASGIVDAFEKEGLKAFGPSQRAAQLESSKIYSKEFMTRHNIPTASYQIFDQFEEVKDYLTESCYPIVLKADGLCAGKGVVVAQNMDEALQAAKEIMVDKKFNEAGSRIIIEECLYGQEVSIFAISDGDQAITLESSQDHKRIFDGDEGPNTGGMGAYSPAPMANQKFINDIYQSVVKPTIDGMKKEGNIFKGVLYVGLIITENGPKVLEYNVRFGDPETQAVLPRIKSDFMDIVKASIHGGIDKLKVEWDSRPSVCIVLASGGYPGDFKKEIPVTGWDSFANTDDTQLFHAGTKKIGDRLLTSGGRVFGVTAKGSDIGSAIKQAYRAVKKITFENMFFRKDIGQKALDILQQNK